MKEQQGNIILHIQQIFFSYLLCVKKCARHKGCGIDEVGCVLILMILQAKYVVIRVYDRINSFFLLQLLKDIYLTKVTANAA